MYMFYTVLYIHVKQKVKVGYKNARQVFFSEWNTEAAVKR